MEAINKVFEYCKECDNLLSGQQRKFCSYECGDIHRAARTVESNGFEIMETMKEEAIILGEQKYLETIFKNSSERAYNQAINLL